MAWLYADGAEIALGISALFLAAAWLMHRAIRKVLTMPAPEQASPPKLDDSAHDGHSDHHR
ncbi:MAG: hypothetical protein OHK0048_11780 [Rhodoferax sp.]